MIDKNSPEWLRMYQAWLEQGQAGYVTIGSLTYRVFQPSDGDIKFEEMKGGIDGVYGSTSVPKTR